MNHLPDSLFDTIESAHEYVGLLAEVVSAARQDLEADISRERGSEFPRRLDAIRLASYNLAGCGKTMVRLKRLSRFRDCCDSGESFGCNRCGLL